MTKPAYFTATDTGFLANDPARGPWSPHHCHAGPVAALAVRAAENAINPAKQMTRLTLDLVRAVPKAEIFVTCDVVRDARTVATTKVAVHDADGNLCASGTTMHLAVTDLGNVPTAPVDPVVFTTAEADDFPLSKAHGKPSFADFAEVRYPLGFGPELGPKSVWLRTPDIVTGEIPSPFQRLCPLADSTNGVSGNALLNEMTFLNTDLTIVMHRPPQGEWIATRAASHWQSNGIGLAQAELHDRTGPVAGVFQTLVLRRP